MLAAGLAPGARAQDSLLLRVFHINDLHGALESRPAPWAQGRRVGGAAALKGLMDSLAAECRCATLRLDGGDQMQGSPVSNWVFGRSVVEVLNRVGLDAAAIGNHEFDWTIDTLQARMRESRYQWLSANTIEKRTRRPPSWIRGWTTLQKGPWRIGVIGLTTTATPVTTRPAHVAHLSFTDGARAVRRALVELRRERPDFVIVVAHDGGFCNPACTGEVFTVARRLDSASVDLIASGHTHSEINTVVNGIPIVQARSNGSNLAVVDFWRRGNGTREASVRVLTVWTDSIRADTGVAAIVERYRAQAAQLSLRPVTEVKSAIERGRGESAMGQLIADAQRALTRADVAIMNNGGIRADLLAGPVNYGQVFEVHPFENLVLKLTLGGDSLLRAFENLVGGPTPDANVSGVEIWYDPGAPPGRRVRRARLDDGREVRPDGRYTVAVNDFMASGGDRYTMFRGASTERTGVSDLDALITHLQSLPRPVEVRRVERIHSQR